MYSVSGNNAYGSVTFSGLTDLLDNLDDKMEPETEQKFRQHLSAISFLVGEASRSLIGNF